MSEPLAALSLMMMVMGVTLLRGGRDTAPQRRGQAGPGAALTDLLHCLAVLGWESDRNGGRRPTFVTPWSRNLLGSLLDRWMSDGLLWSDLVHPADRDHVIAAWNRARTVGRNQDLEYRLVSCDDRVIWVRDVIRCVASTDDGTPAFHGAWVDITAEKRVVQLDAELRQSGRLECLGRSTSGIAHDFGNLLTVILGRSDLLDAALAPGDAQRQPLQAIQVAARRASSLVRRLLRLAGRERAGHGVIDLTGTVSEMHELLLPLMGERVEVVIETEEFPRFVPLECAELEQIILNLSLNARDAMPAGGRLLIRTLETVVGAGDGADTGVTPGRYGLLTVSDTGCGIEPTACAQIFDPFFTTKDPDAGRGLGLAITRRIAEQHGGGVTVTSQIGDGTVFRVYLPCCEGAVPATLMKGLATTSVAPAARAA
jgi:signal transduction histidine kinase